uniref:Period circadian regulator 3 n=1 Tax=Pavo cristatus TaxID=9049 RepID=A0A8C9EXU7_PAVCR
MGIVFFWGGVGISYTKSPQQSSTSVLISNQLDWSQSHKDLMVVIQEIKKCLPEEKRSSSKPSTISALNYALRCVQQVRANNEFFQALNDGRMFQTDVSTYSTEELVTVASEHTPKNNDTFVAVFSLLSGRIVHISEQAASILNHKKKVLESSRFVELLAPQDAGVFYAHTDQSHLPLWNTESQTASLCEYAQVKSFFCRIRGGKDQEQEMHWYPFRITPYLVHVCTSVHVDAESCCLALAEKIHSGYEAPRIPTDKRIFTTTHTPGCVFLEIDDRAVPLLGYLPQDLIGTSILLYLHPEDRPLMIAIHRKILKFAGQPPFEYLPIRFCTQNGDYVILDTSWSSFVNPWSRKVAFIIGRHKVRTNVSSGYGSLGSSGSYEHYISVASSSDSNGNCAEETQEPKARVKSDLFSSLYKEVTTMENTPVGNEHVEVPPLNAQNPITVAEELKPVGLTKETLSAHTQKEEQNYVDKFRRRILLSPFRTYLQRDSRSNNGRSCDQGNSPSMEMTPASCKNGKKGKFKHQKPQRRSSDRRSCSKNRSSEKRRTQKQSLSPSEVSRLSSSSTNFSHPVGFPVYSDALSSFPASSLGEGLAIYSSKPEPTSLSQLCCGAPSFPALSHPNIGMFMAVFFHSFPIYTQMPPYAFLPSTQNVYFPSSYPCTTLPPAPPPSAPSPIALNSVDQSCPASSATSTEEQLEGQHGRALQLSCSRSSSPLQLNLLQEELPESVEPSVSTDVKACAEAKCVSNMDF